MTLKEFANMFMVRGDTVAIIDYDYGYSIAYYGYINYAPQEITEKDVVNVSSRKRKNTLYISVVSNREEYDKKMREFYKDLGA